MWQDTLTELRQFAGSLPQNVLILGEVTSEQRDETLHELRAACGRSAYRLKTAAPFERRIVPNRFVVVIDQLADLSADEQQALSIGSTGIATQWFSRLRKNRCFRS